MPPGWQTGGVNIAAPVGDVTPGLLGFLVVAALGLALYFLIKSMNKRISKIEVPREADLAKAEQESENDKPR